MKPAAVIPAYNEAASISRVVEGVKKHGLPVIVVDDCSDDDTAGRAREAGAMVVCHETNRGKGQAVLSGVAEARRRGFTHTLLLDGDGQHDTELVPRFLAAGMTADMVLGSRMHDPSGMPFIRRLTNRSMSIVVSWFAGVRITDSQSGYRMISMAAWDAVPVFSSRFDMESEFLITACRAEFSLREVPITTIYGDEKSKISPWKDTWRFFRLLWRLSTRRPWREARRRRKEGMCS